MRSVEVVELMSSVIEHLVKGEVMQMRGGHLKDCGPLEYYFHKNYYKVLGGLKGAVVRGIVFFSILSLLDKWKLIV